jgi:galactokinase
MAPHHFSRAFGVEPAFEIRSPGRVNLIGEHTDYSLLPVMPLAIDRSVTLLVAGTDDGRLIAESVIFPGVIDIDLAAPPTSASGWHRYLLAAVRALGVPGLSGAAGHGARLLVGGDLPPTGGLSSSSAFTVGVIAALDRLWGLGLNRADYPAIAISAERSIGVEGGMMDQTVIALAQRGHALRIDFDPPGLRQVPIPDGMGVVAAYSGSPAPKGGDANLAYNTRVVACRAAALLLGVPRGIDVSVPPVLSRVVAAGGVDLSGLPAETTATRVASMVDVDVGLMVRMTAGRFDPDAPLPLAAVARHVVSEAGRVDQAEAALKAGDMAELGRLLDASHASLQDFGASSPSLDTLVDAMREAGAWGARLTGAGFGGYAVAVCPDSSVDEVVEAAMEATGGPAFRVVASEGVG